MERYVALTEGKALPGCIYMKLATDYLEPASVTGASEWWDHQNCLDTGGAQYSLLHLPPHSTEVYSCKHQRPLKVVVSYTSQMTPSN